MTRALTNSAAVGLTHQIIHAIVSTIQRHASVDRIILYGSRTRGDFDERSDIDLAIEGEADPALLRGFLEEEVPTLRKFDVVKVSDLDETMAASVNREGMVLYDKAEESAYEL